MKNMFLGWRKILKATEVLRNAKFVQRLFSISSMGIKALDAHANGAKHKERLPCKQSLFSAFKKKAENEYQQQKPLSLIHI